mmetsp:Transcript_1484/g.3031  ORF Transcript_1484/g.3031 Transcript_1484/m.3031 type:complete len:372 (-) Transcript_1484:255-1370(-)|eukprot:CAMPEP_0181316110 /NCGR_PEP_ID=MMETSP1101-20121128/15721_1 /TAXON_ID=46948 /ORGANISM="Rhodomonas abbreviata, Strain Caron Lab Isolate" /LENGTH=371 /DNA_ID=CAMNT_0023423337 /DNA_START=221 /DNA_END=1336 /DNA_ORIENTATION=+
MTATSGKRTDGTRTRHAAKASQKAIPLKYFNIRSAERFVFKRRDKRCLTLSPRSSLIPVFIHFSDIFPELVQSTLSKCKTLISACPRVVLLRPNQEKILSDDVVWEGPGSSIPHRCWDRHGTLLRTLDIVQYKVSAQDRKRELLPIEQDLWNVVEPFLCRINNFSQHLISGSSVLDEMNSKEEVLTAMKEDIPWCLTVDAIVSHSAPSVGDREHILHFSPKAGVFVREFIDADEGFGSAVTSVPLVTLPCRLQNDMPIHPPLPQTLQFLSSILPRISSLALRDAISNLSAEMPVDAVLPEVECKLQAQKRYLEGVLVATACGEDDRPMKRQRTQHKSKAGRSLVWTEAQSGSIESVESVQISESDHLNVTI